MRKYVFGLLTAMMLVPTINGADLTKEEQMNKEKWGFVYPVPGYREGMVDMVQEQDLPRRATRSYPSWYRGTGEASTYKEDSTYFYKWAIGSSKWVPTGLNADNISMGTMTFKAGTVYPVHSHPAWEIYYVIEGEGIITKYDKEYKVKPGSFIMNRPYDLHAIKNASDTNPLKVVWVWWTEDPTQKMDVMSKGGLPFMPKTHWKDKESAKITPAVKIPSLKGKEAFKYMESHLPKK